MSTLLLFLPYAYSRVVLHCTTLLFLVEVGTRRFVVPCVGDVLSERARPGVFSSLRDDFWLMKSHPCGLRCLPCKLPPAPTKAL